MKEKDYTPIIKVMRFVRYGLIDRIKDLPDKDKEVAKEVIKLYLDGTIDKSTDSHTIYQILRKQDIEKLIETKKTIFCKRIEMPNVSSIHKIWFNHEDNTYFITNLDHNITWLFNAPKNIIIKELTNKPYYNFSHIRF